MSSLDAIWALEQAPDLTDDERADAIAQLKASEWSVLETPIKIGSITIANMTVHGQAVEFTGEGGTVDWPLRLVNAPIAVPDPMGVDVDANGQAWRVDCLAVLTEILSRFV